MDIDLKSIDFADFCVKALRRGIVGGNRVPSTKALEEAMQQILKKSNETEPAVVFMAFIAFAVVVAADVRLWNEIVGDVKWEHVVQSFGGDQ